MALPKSVVIIVTETPPDHLDSILNDVFFDMKRLPDISEVKAVIEVIKNRPDHIECQTALDICRTFLEDNEI